MKSLATLSLLCLANTVCAQYQLVRKYSGSTFFQGWSFYGNYDNLTNGAYFNFHTFCIQMDQFSCLLGDVWYLDQTNATSQNLAYVNSAGNAIIKVDNTTNVPYNQKRNSVRIFVLSELSPTCHACFRSVSPRALAVWLQRLAMYVFTKLNILLDNEHLYICSFLDRRSQLAAR